MDIKSFGWDQYFENEFKKISAEGLIPGRIIADYGHRVRVITEYGEIQVNRPGMKYDECMQMAVGDWVVLKSLQNDNSYLIQGVLPRKTKFSRAAAGIEVKEQIVAANVDIVFLIQSLNRDFNMRRLERYMITAWDSGAIPVVVLTKADCCEDVETRISIVQDTVPGVEVHAISCITGEGISEIRKYLTPGKTIALLGSSGVGKSTLINYLTGKEIIKTGEIREDDDKGKHTTTHRELFLLPDGGLIMDTPGMRSLMPWDGDAGMDALFGDIEELVTQCRFSDCQHNNEPGCAIKEALRNGTLEIERWESWSKLQKEIANFEHRKLMKDKIKEKQVLKRKIEGKENRRENKVMLKDMDLE